MIPRFKKSRFEPKPIETDYWIDLNENEYGGVFKYYDNNAMVWKQTESITREREPLFTSSPAYKITTNDIDYWNSKVGIEDFDAFKEEVLSLGSKFEGVTVETLEYYNDILRSDIMSEIETSSADKADKASTLNGYGIKDAYTKNQIDKKFEEWKIDLPENVSYFKNDAGYVTESNLEEKLPDYIVSDANYVHTDNNFNNQYKSKLDSLTDDLKAIEYDDTEVKNLINQNTQRIAVLQTTVDDNIAATAESMSKEIAKKANADEVYTKQYLNEVFTQFVRKTHKTYGFIDERPTLDLTTEDTGFIFYDYTVNEPLLWVADEWRLLRTNEAFDGFLLEEDIVNQIVDWEYEDIENTDFTKLKKYTGEYSSTMDLVVPNVYIDNFVLSVGDTMEYWAGKNERNENWLTYGYVSTSLDYDGNAIKQYRPIICETPIITQRRRVENLNPGYTIPGVDDNPDDDVPAEDITINYIQNVLGTPVLTPIQTFATETQTALFELTTETTPVNSFGISLGVRTIGTGAFCNMLSSTDNVLNIPAGVEFVDDFAFAQSSITEVSFPRNPIYFGYKSFSGCPLTKVNFPKTLDWDKIKDGYGVYAFAGCSGKVDLTLNEGVKAIPAGCFYNTKVALKEFPDSLEYLGAYAFTGSLTNFAFDSNKISYFGSMSLQDCSFTSIVFRDDVKILPPALFGNTKHANVTSVVLPPNLEKAYLYSFPRQLMRIGMPFVTSPKLKELPPYAFEYYGHTTNYPSIVDEQKIFPMENVKLVLSEGLESIGFYSTFGSCFSQDLILPDSLKYIASYGISKPYGFVNKTLNIPKNVKIIGGMYSLNGSYCSPEDIKNGMDYVYSPLSPSGYSGATYLQYLEDGGSYSEYAYASFYQFGTSSMKAFTVDPENKWFKAIDGVLFDITGKRMVGYPCARGTSVYKIPEGCVYMDMRVFAGTGLKDTFTVTTPDGTEQQITSMDKSSRWRDFYYGDGQLREIVIPNTMINYSPDELKEMFPECHYKGELNMLWASQDYMCSIERFTAKEDNPLYKNDGDWLLSKDGTKLQIIPMGMKGVQRIPNSVTEIVPGAFQFSYLDLHWSELNQYDFTAINIAYPMSFLYGLHLIIPATVVTMSDVLIFEFNVMNRSPYNSVTLEDGNPVFVQDATTGVISRR